MTDVQNPQQDKQISVKHEADQDRYIIEVDGALAGFAEYDEFTLDGAKVREFDHTVIDSNFRGQGLSKPLIKGALDDTLTEEGTRIRATCSAVKGFVSKNPEYEQHLA